MAFLRLSPEQARGVLRRRKTVSHLKAWNPTGLPPRFAASCGVFRKGINVNLKRFQIPNVTQMIKSIAQNMKVQQYIVEKYCAMSYLLTTINYADGLGENLVLKGGTALKKLYFADYRFSEDLDYSSREMGPIKQIDALVETVVHSMGEMLSERGPFQVSLEPLILKLPHPGEQKAYLVPYPSGFLAKNGSNTLVKAVSGIPSAVSITARIKR